MCVGGGLIFRLGWLVMSFNESINFIKSSM